MKEECGGEREERNVLSVSVGEGGTWPHHAEQGRKDMKDKRDRER